MAAISNNTYLNILVSYAYINKAHKFEQIMHTSSQEGRMNTMLDSGAFTAYMSPKKNSFINLDEYCKYLEKNSRYYEKYVTFDVINNDKQSKVNYETMLRRGHNPMYVFTSYDTDYNYLKFAASNNKHICVAGGLLANRQWVLKRYQDVYKYTQGKLHGLAFVKNPHMFQVPLHSVDSSSWVQLSSVFGKLPWFDNGIKSVSYKDVLRKKIKMPLNLANALDRYKVSLKDFSNLKNHQGNKGIGLMLSIAANIEYQKYSKKKGLNLFLAVNQWQHLKKILLVDENITNNTLTYEKFKQADNS